MLQTTLGELSELICPRRPAPRHSSTRTRSAMIPTAGTAVPHHHLGIPPEGEGRSGRKVHHSTQLLLGLLDRAPRDGADRPGRPSTPTGASSCCWTSPAAPTTKTSGYASDAGSSTSATTITSATTSRRRQRRPSARRSTRSTSSMAASTNATSNIRCLTTGRRNTSTSTGWSTSPTAATTTLGRRCGRTTGYGSKPSWNSCLFSQEAYSPNSLVFLQHGPVVPAIPGPATMNRDQAWGYVDRWDNRDQVC